MLGFGDRLAEQSSQRRSSFDLDCRVGEVVLFPLEAGRVEMLTRWGI